MRDEKKPGFKEWIVPVVKNTRRNGGFFVCEFKTPRFFPPPLPGQFLMISTGQPHLPLRRPMAFYDFNSKTFSILYAPQGKGTLALSFLKPGEPLSILAPLGNAFEPTLAQKKTWIVSGGVGLAPFLLLIKKIPLKFRKNIKLFFGAKKKAQLSILKDFKNLKVEILTSTDEKTKGTFHGTVIDRLIYELKISVPDQILTCGPSPMMKRSIEVAHEHRIPAWVSLEAKMGCGIGVCLSCVSSFPYLKEKLPLLCQKGPIFQTQPLP